MPIAGPSASRTTRSARWSGKREGALTLEELDGATAGLVALGGRALLDTRHHGVGGLLDRLVGLFGRHNVYVELQRHLLRDEEAANAALDALAQAYRVPVIASQRRPLCGTCGSTAVRRADVCASSHDARQCRPFARAECGAVPEISGIDGAALCRSPRCDRERFRPGRAARLHDGRSGLPLSGVSGAGRRDRDVVPPAHHGSRCPRPVSPVSRQGARPDRAGARSHREARPCRLFPDRVGHRQLRAAAGHSGAGSRVGGQQRRLLQPGHHGRRSDCDGPALRAVSLRGTRRMARHRSRSSERRSPGARHPARVREIRPAWRSDDRERDHLPQPQRRARSRQGAFTR